MLAKSLKNSYNNAMEIITTPDPRLRQKSKKVSHITAETEKIVSDMIQASLDWEHGHPHEISTAMAAPQMGINQRIIIVRDNLEDKSNNHFTALINPEVIKTEGKIIADYEGCLSVPFIYGLVSRPEKVRIKAKTLDGTEVRIKARDFLARILLHEIDHLDGVLFVDHIKNQPDAFFELDQQGDLKPLDYATRIQHNATLFPDEA